MKMKMKLRRKTIHLFIIANTLIITSVAAAIPAVPSEPVRPTAAINQFIAQMVKENGFSKEELVKLLTTTPYNQEVINRITHPFEKKPWDFYRNFFVRPDLITNGVKYWQQHKKVLMDVSQRYGVPASIIVAIIGIESYFGKHSGAYNELEALMTLSFYYPKRQKFFQAQLKHFLLLTRSEGFSPSKLKGSYAGALGIPQFMPSSYRCYGVDYSNNHSINLFTNHDDAIASVGNYLKKAGWVRGQVVAVPAKIPAEIPQNLLSTTARPNYSLTKFKSYHVLPAEKLPKQSQKNFKAALIAMKSDQSIEYWLVSQNFHAIMRYNPRIVYALAVFELSRSVKNAYEQQEPSSSASLSIARSRKTGRS